MKKKIYIVVTKNLKTNKLSIRKIYQHSGKNAHDLARKLKRHFNFLSSDMEVYVVEQVIEVSLEQCI